MNYSVNHSKHGKSRLIFAGKKKSTGKIFAGKIWQKHILVAKTGKKIFWFGTFGEFCIKIMKVNEVCDNQCPRWLWSIASRATLNWSLVETKFRVAHVETKKLERNYTKRTTVP